MISPPLDSRSADNDLLLGRLLDEFAERTARGEALDLDAFLREHAAHSRQLRDLLPALQSLIDLSRTPSAASGISSAAFVASAAWTLPTGTLGDFRLLRELGRGGMGVVYEAQQISLERPVAVKCLPLAGLLSETQMQRFKIEARAAALLHHPHIVGVHTVGCERGIHFYAMELVRGSTLAEVIAALRKEVRGQRPEVREGINDRGRNCKLEIDNFQLSICNHDSPPDAQLSPIDHSELRTPNSALNDTVAAALTTEYSTSPKRYFRHVARLGQEAAEALEYAHEQGIVHRDIKPSNLMVDEHGRLRITDFGLAHMTGGHDLTMTGDVLGTLRYMSPEQAAGRPVVDPRVDVYGLGVTLYELLTLRPAFDAADRRQLLQEVLEKSPPRPRQLDPSIPADLETILLKAAAKEPTDRYTTARELGEDLRRFQEGEPIRARPMSRTQRSWRWCRRRPVVAGLSALVAVLVLTLAAMTTYSQVRSRAAAREARWQQYLSDVHFAMQAWDEGDVGRATDLLQRYLPESGGEDLRKFEWHYLWRQCQKGQQTPMLIEDVPIGGLCLSPNGELLAVGLDDSDVDGRAVDVWHLPTRRKLYQLQAPTSSGQLAFSLDGNTLASAHLNGGGIKLWDMQTGSVRHQIDGDKDNVWGIAYSPNGKLLASASGDGTMRLWDTDTRAEIHRFDAAVVRWSRVAFSPDGKWLAACEDHSVKLWDVEARSLVRTLVGHSAPTFSLAFSPDGSTIATSSEDRTARLWRVADGAPLVIFTGHTAPVRDLCFSRDGATLATTSDDGTLRFWDAATGRLQREMRGHSGGIWAVTCTPDGATFITGGNDAKIRFWDAAGSPETDVLYGHTNEVSSVDIHPDDRTLASASWDKTVRFWDLHQGEHPETRSTPELLQVLSYSPSGHWLAVGGENGLAELWTTDGKRTVRLPGHKWSILAMAWSPDEKTLAVGDLDHNVILWDVATATPRRRLMGHTDWLYSAAFSPDGGTLVTRCRDHTLRIWDVESGSPLTIEEPSGWRSPTAFSPDGKLLATGVADGGIKIWRVDGWIPVDTLRGHTADVKDLAFSPDGQTLASCADDGLIKLWDMPSGAQRCTLRRHVGEVQSVRFTTDGRTLVSCGQDRTLRIWRTAD